MVSFTQAQVTNMHLLSSPAMIIGTSISQSNFQSSTTPKRSAHKSKLPRGFVPGKYSVICGKGKLCSKSSGNSYLRSLVHEYLKPYSKADNKTEKSAIVSEIIDRVREASPIGSFIKQECNGDWWEVEDCFAREKIGCIFRDILHAQYRSSTKSKQARKKTEEKDKKKKKSPVNNDASKNCGKVSEGTKKSKNISTNQHGGDGGEGSQRNKKQPEHQQQEKNHQHQDYYLQQSRSRDTRCVQEKDMHLPSVWGKNVPTKTLIKSSNTTCKSETSSCVLSTLQAYPERCKSSLETLSIVSWCNQQTKFDGVEFSGVVPQISLSCHQSKDNTTTRLLAPYYYQQDSKDHGQFCLPSGILPVQENLIISHKQTWSSIDHGLTDDQASSSLLQAPLNMLDSTCTNFEDFPDDISDIFNDDE